MNRVVPMRMRRPLVVAVPGGMVHVATAPAHRLMDACRSLGVGLPAGGVYTAADLREHIEDHCVRTEAEWDRQAAEGDRFDIRAAAAKAKREGGFLFRVFDRLFGNGGRR